MTAYRDFKGAADQQELNMIRRLDARPRPPIFCDRPSPRACEFVTGPITPAMGKWADTISATYYSKRAARVRAFLRGVAG